MLTHVVAEVLQQRHFLRQSIGKCLQSVEMFSSVLLDVLHVSDDTQQRKLAVRYQPAQVCQTEITLIV